MDPWFISGHVHFYFLPSKYTLAVPVCSVAAGLVYQGGPLISRIYLLCRLVSRTRPTSQLVSMLSGS